MCALILLVCVAVVSSLAHANRYQMSADGVAYLRLAGYMAEGRLDRAVTGEWAPLLSICVALFSEGDGEDSRPSASLNVNCCRQLPVDNRQLGLIRK